jgi:hypothetical protein
LHIDDNYGSNASASGNGASAGYYQFLTATRTINPSATSIALYINLLGNAGDIFDVCLPTAAFVPSLVASQLKQNSGEIIRSTSHWNPPLLTPFIINFPATQICSGCGLYGWNGIDLEAISLGTVHNTISNVYSKVEWVSTAVDAQFFTGASVNVTNGLIFGLQASTQVSGKTFPTSIGRWPLYHDGTVTIFTGTAGLVPINATFDFTDVDVSRPTSVD